ncbi:hypothetical protein [Nostoc commune]|nr:hypothetical protein [Nostoc commune]
MPCPYEKFKTSFPSLWAGNAALGAAAGSKRGGSPYYQFTYFRKEAHTETEYRFSVERNCGGKAKHPLTNTERQRS